MIAKIVEQQIEQPVVNNDRYELFEEATMKDINGNDVVVLKSIGIYFKSDLQRQIENLNSEKARIQGMLDLMN